MPALHATSRSPPPTSEPSIINPTQKVLSTFQQYPTSTSTRPLSTPIQLKQLQRHPHHPEVLRHPQNHRFSEIRTTELQQQFSFDETSNISNPKLQPVPVQSSTLPNAFSSSKRTRKSRSSDRHRCSEEGSVRNRRVAPPTAAGNDADTESDSIESIYKRLSGPQTSPHTITDSVRAFKANSSVYNLMKLYLWYYKFKCTKSCTMIVRF